MITALSKQFDTKIQQRIDEKTKPLGALGILESVALQLANIQSDRQFKLCERITLARPTMLVFAGDHGIAAKGVSIAPSDVTFQMVQNFLAGGAAINCFCRINQIQFKVIDAGMITEIDPRFALQHPEFINQRLGSGTADFSVQAAMSANQVQAGLLHGKTVTDNEINSGAELLMFGEMGIANTSSASAIFSALSDVPVAASVGRGTGISVEQLTLKQRLIQQALKRIITKEPLAVLAEVGGFEIVQIVGGILGCAEKKVPVLVDGFIVSVAAYVACCMNKNVRDYLLFAHCSNESAHRLLLSELSVQPLLDLALRLGEGTGAALAFPLLSAAVSFYNDMASFDSAGVTVP